VTEISDYISCNLLFFQYFIFFRSTFSAF